MSNLRIAGLIIGVIGLIATFFIYRGPKWKRSNFVLFALFNISLIAVSINPNIINSIRDALSLIKLKEAEYLPCLLSLTFSYCFIFCLPS